MLPKLATALRDLRSERDLTQKELQERSGVSDTIISRLENGRITDPKVSTLKRLANGLGISLSEFMQKAERDSSTEDSVLKKLRNCKDELRDQFHVRSIGIFGSVARGESTQESDVDILVEFQEGHRDIFNHSRLEEYLESKLDRTVDLVMDSREAREDHPRLRMNIDEDLIRV